MDYIRLPQDELENRINATKAYIRRQQKRHEPSKDSEVELCYLQREEEQRDRARKIHKKYLAKIEKLRREEEEALRESDEGEAAYDA